MAHRDSLERLQHLQAPVLLVKGTGSEAYYHQIIDLLADRLSGARVTEMPGMHAPHIVSKDRFLSELDHFQSSE